MNPHDLADRIEQSPNLRKLRAKLIDELQFRMDASAQFDPMLVIMLISLVVQVIIHCREQRADCELVQDIRDIRTLPPRRLMRLRRRANALWRVHSGCSNAPKIAAADGNPLLTALYELGENADEETIREIIQLAQEG